MADKKGNADDSEPILPDQLFETTSEVGRRIRTLTEKGREMYETQCQRFVSDLTKCKDHLTEELMTIAIIKLDKEKIKSAIQRLELTRHQYELTHKTFVAFLEGYSTEESLKEKNIQISDFKEVQFSQLKTQSALDAANSNLELMELDTKSQKSKRSSSSKRSAAKLKIAEDTARLKCLEAQLMEEEKMANIQRRRSEVNTMLELNRIKEEVADEESEDDKGSHDDPLREIPRLSSSEKTMNFLQTSHLNPRAEPHYGREARVPNHDQTPVHQPFHPSVAVTAPRHLSEFLLKKDITINRFTKFDDDPMNYSVWRTSFKNIVDSLRLTPQEETDLLIKWLGMDSSRQALSLRAANIHDPATGLRRIWERLDKRYGAPELIMSTLNKKVSGFPRLQFPKDTHRLYDLVDILSEILCHQEDPKYSALLSFYDTSGGVNPVISKLPPFLQNKWMDRAMRYKTANNLTFPPFSYFTSYVEEMCTALNDPSFAFEQWCPSDPAPQRTSKGAQRQLLVSSKKTDLKPACPLHPKSISMSHTLEDCKVFGKKPKEEKLTFLKEFKACFRCLKTDHNRRECKTSVRCGECNGTSHVTVMHVPKATVDAEQISTATRTSPHGGEHSSTPTVSSLCTAVCGKGFKGRSCAKTLAVRIHRPSDPEKHEIVYAMLDEHCNRTLASPNLLDALGVDTAETRYTLSSCSGSFQMAGRVAHDLIVQPMDRSCSITLPTVIECTDIPKDISEIPTPEIAQHFQHLIEIKDFIHPYDPRIQIGLLIGRDVMEVHHVLEQIIGPKDTPFAQRLSLGWVIIGEVCLEQVRRSEQRISVNSKKTRVLHNGRTSLFEPCPRNLSLTDSRSSGNKADLKVRTYLGDGLFHTSEDDNCVGLSIEDRQFLDIMNREMHRNEKGNWSAPLPFRLPRIPLPNNRTQAEKRADMLERSLHRDPIKCEHFVKFMSKVLESGAAEVAPPHEQGKEVWYLPLFGVYNRKKPQQIRGVFDSSAEYNGISLNKTLITGPNLTNNLQGILLRFRKDQYAIVADIEQMFYSFAVNEEHRDYIRFLWYKDNDPNSQRIEYRMVAHAFGNSPSPAVATYGLQKCVEDSTKYGSDVKKFVAHNFYVDDGLTSVPTKCEAIDLLERTQTILKNEGNLHLHKIASNEPAVMNAFSREDLCKEMVSLNLERDSLPIHQSLGLSWDLQSDAFTFQIQLEEKPDTRRGCLSTLNSIYDPLGFVAPMLIQGKSSYARSRKQLTGTIH